MERKKDWLVVYTRSRWEKKVAEMLTRKGIENYCPLKKEVRQWADRKKQIEEPLFSSYVFVHAEPSEHLSIQQTEGIVNFIFWLGKPAVVRDNEIDAIKQYANNDYNVSIEKIKVNVNDTVKITHGPLMHQEGNVVEVQANSVKVHLPSLGYAIIAIEKKHIDKVKIPKDIFNTIRKRTAAVLNSFLTLNLFHANFR